MTRCLWTATWIQDDVESLGCFVWLALVNLLQNCSDQQQSHYFVFCFSSSFSTPYCKSYKDYFQKDVWPPAPSEAQVGITSEQLVEECKHHTTPCAVHGRKRFLACGSRDLNWAQHAFLCLLVKRLSSSSQFMCHAQSLLPYFPPLPFPQHGAPSLLFLLHGGTHCDPHLEDSAKRP